jgi:hypothetical protein
VFRYVLKGFTTLNVKLKRKFRITGFYPDWANPTYQIVRVIVFAFMLIVIFLIYQEAIRPYLVSVFLGLSLLVQQDHFLILLPV